MNIDKTIAAISTPLGEGGIGIVRISGDDAFTIGKKVFAPRNRKGHDYPCSHHLYYGHIISGQKEIIDEALVSFMKAPHTYTCEDTVEINCHSGIFILRAILKEVLEAGAKMAQPGEFTRRAFVNGRIDLSQAESIIKIIKARSEEAVKIAAANIKGRLSEKINEIRGRILDLWARIEAQLDFPEDLEEDTGLEKEIFKELKQINEMLNELSSRATRGQIMQEGLVSAIVGKPNAGKSSLLNALLKEQRAIVHELPGTTRDLLEGYLTVRGYPLKLIDTAGIHGTSDPVERAGIKKTRAAVTEARLLIIVLDGSTAWGEDDEKVAALLQKDRLAVIVVNKVDLPQQINKAEIESRFPGYPVVKVSAIKNEGIECLEETIVKLLERNLGVIPKESTVMANLRHTRLVEEVQNLLEMVLKTATERPVEVLSIDLREAWSKLGEITGETLSDELLDKIFSEFCIGK